MAMTTANADTRHRAPIGGPWNPQVWRIRKEMQERFSDKLSMEEIATFAYDQGAIMAEMLAELEHAHDMIKHYLKAGYLPHMSAEEAEQLVRNPDSAIRKARGA